MKIAEEIIEVLGRENPNIENALTKTKILLHRLGERELVAWVNSELNGYSGKDKIPDYRIIPTRVLVTATNGYTTRWTNFPVPLSHLDDDFRKSLTNTEVGHSVANLQEWTKSKRDALSKPLPTEICSLLAEGLEDGIYVETAHVEIGKSQVIGILAQIKSRLLDFILEISARIPDDVNDAEAKEASKRIDTAGLFQNAIFGDNVTIMVGNHNVQSVANTISVNDFDSLATVLRQNRVDEADIRALEEAINKDGTTINDNSREFGPHVRQWMKEMLSKAVDAAWQIEVGVASSLLATALNSYYGWL